MPLYPRRNPPRNGGQFHYRYPFKAIEEYRKDHPPTDRIDEAFRSLVSKEEIEQMEGILGSVNMSRHEYYPFDGDPLSCEHLRFGCRGEKVLEATLETGRFCKS
jgi:hypothetical protein